MQDLINQNLIETLNQKAQAAQRLGAGVEIVGSWVWATFEAKPPPETRQALKAEHFRWNPTRHVWQFAGTRSRRSPADTQELISQHGYTRGPLLARIGRTGEKTHVVSAVYQQDHETLLIASITPLCGSKKPFSLEHVISQAVHLATCERCNPKPKPYDPN